MDLCRFKLTEEVPIPPTEGRKSSEVGFSHRTHRQDLMTTRRTVSLERAGRWSLDMSCRSFHYQLGGVTRCCPMNSHPPSAGHVTSNLRFDMTNSVKSMPFEAGHPTLSQRVTCDRILRLKEVLRIVALGRSTLYLQIKRNAFPKSVLISRRSVGWKESSIRDWLDQRGINASV